MKILKPIFKFIMNRLFIVAVLLAAQIAILFYAFYQISNLGYLVILVYEIIAFIIAWMILNRDFSPEYKISWIILVLLFPLAGSAFYLIFGRVQIPKKLIKRMDKIIQNNSKHLTEDMGIPLENKNHNKLSNYVKNTSGKQVLNNSKATYLSPGEVFFDDLLKYLKRAKKFIFLEFYIIEPGKMWDPILKLLEQKVIEGVEVRIIYDDFGCMRKVPFKFKKNITKKGIKIVNFNPFIPRLSSFLNYRDHRKVIVIDGVVGYTGGINLADEYINKLDDYGHWKDSVIKIEGDGVYPLTSLFLHMWDFSTGELDDYLFYKINVDESFDDIIQIFGDSPFDGHTITRNVYIDVINNAKKYVHITTPYLIIDNVILEALRMAAASGVDVKIITPHMPDKKLIFYLTQSYYKPLIRAGVKIYEYTPGFMHSKMVCSDNNIAIIGTVNLDYRSFFLHFELSTILYKSNSINAISEDISEIISLSKLITLSEIEKRSVFKKIIAFFLKIFAPMM